MQITLLFRINETILSIGTLNLIVPVLLELGVKDEADYIGGSTHKFYQLIVCLLVRINLFVLLVKQELADILRFLLAVELACDAAEFE